MRHEWRDGTPWSKCSRLCFLLLFLVSSEPPHCPSQLWEPIGSLPAVEKPHVVFLSFAPEESG